MLVVLNSFQIRILCQRLVTLIRSDLYLLEPIKLESCILRYQWQHVSRFSATRPGWRGPPPMCRQKLLLIIIIFFFFETYQKRKIIPFCLQEYVKVKGHAVILSFEWIEFN
jgi:hypothetical protein